MKEQFVNEFLTKLYNKVPDEYLDIIQKELILHTKNYDINKKETSVSIYEGHIPDFYKIYMVSRKISGLSQKTLDLYNLYLQDFFLQVNKDIHKITANDIRIYLYNTQETRNISNRTLDSRRSAIHVFFEWSTDEGYLEKNPCRSVQKIKYERKDREPLTPMELEKVRAACKDIRETAMIEFFYSTGCRVSELVVMNINDVNFDKNEVTLFGKGSKHRKSYLTAKARLSLEKYLATRDDKRPALFVSERNPHDRLKKEAVERIVKNIGFRSDINRRLFPHLLRHTCATDLVQKKCPIENVQKLLGHVKTETTLIYARINMDDIKREHMRCIS